VGAWLHGLPAGLAGRTLLAGICLTGDSSLRLTQLLLRRSGHERNDDVRGLDVHARSIHAAAIDTMTGELTRAKFAAMEDAVPCLSGLSGPVRAAYEAGPTGFGFYRLAQSAGSR
jgi:hypothetical protein